ncbi:hypothetical protein BDZ90DRAFT_60258 [Jaminaea rosea]|uniref:RRM domain-containing protein n=1 Tax=Jaminaea rosea TaxID=1569628 RepID=A0A316UPA1_9BASI|nr:hypothetical protein BDZ90DRAFT_60258 [Jaminaea rosea]PWN25703.1 hypothetical protein BDZ90DRAFT_60258 [Jaminaea rosea]
MHSSRRSGPAGNGNQRGPQRSASGNMARQNAAPYSRPNAPSQSYPPSQITIRGASSLPTQVLVSNLARGTSSEDIRQTFLQFGDIIRVKDRKSNNNTDDRSVAYEVLFEDKPAAQKAVEQLDGVLADGRILSVVIESDHSSNVPVAPRGTTSHQQQVMTARDRKAIAAAAHQGATAAALAAAQRAGRGAAPVGPGGRGQTGAPTAPSLASRLGGLPLAQRLGGVKGQPGANGKGGAGAGSDLTNLEAKKTKRAAKKAAAAAAAQTSSDGAAQPAVKKRPRGGKKAKAGAATGNNGSGGSGGMEID